MRSVQILCILISGALATRESHSQIRIPNVESTEECGRHCDTLRGCTDWLFEKDRGCFTIFSTDVMMAMMQDGVELQLLQIDQNCSERWHDDDCGWQMGTDMLGDCTFDRPLGPDQCMAYCSKGCGYFNDGCTASCQPIIEIELIFDPPTKILLAIPDGYEDGIKMELALLLGIDEYRIVDVSAKENVGGTITIYLSILPGPEPRTPDIAEIFEGNVTSLIQSHPSLQRLQGLDRLICHNGCMACTPIDCPSEIHVGESCVENQNDGCGNLCPNPCHIIGHRCFQQTCHPAAIDDAMKCEPLMQACATSPDGLCREFVIKFANGTCLNAEFDKCYGGDTKDEGYKRGVAVLECFIAITLQQNCIPTLDCLPRLWDCRADETKGCTDLLDSILFDLECPPVYSGPALEDCYMSLDQEHLATDRSLSLATELLSCMQFACWDECDEIGGIKDTTRQVCFTSCDENGCSETLQEVLASGVLCDESLAPPCILVDGITFELNYYQFADAEGTICQAITNTGTGTSSFFVQNTLFDTLGDNQLSKFCIVTDAETGELVDYLGDTTALVDAIIPELFFELAPTVTVEACLDLFQYYDLAHDHQYILECPSRVLSYKDVITLHTLGAGFRGATQNVMITTEPAPLLMARPKRRWEQEDEHIYHKYERTLLQECAPDSFSDCTPDQIERIQNSYELACNKVMASTLYSQTNGGDKTKKYFMTNTGLDEIHNGYVNIVTLLQGGSQVKCVPFGSGSCSDSTLAYVTGTDPSKTIKICDPKYFESSRYYFTTIIHEASHFVGQGDTDDVTYSCSESFDLSAEDAQRNARNWEGYPTDWCSEDDETCIPLDSILMTRFGPVMASDISLGTEVLSVNSEQILEFSTVHTLSHKDTATMTTFLQFDYFKDNGELSWLQTTPNHFIYRDTSMNSSFSASETVVARNVKIGDFLWIKIEDCEGADCFVQAEIVNINKVRKRGFISPMTVTGNVVVGGVLVSSYGAIPGLATHEHVHYAASILRIGCEVYGSVVSSIAEFLSGKRHFVKMFYTFVEFLAA